MIKSMWVQFKPQKERKKEKTKDENESCSCRIQHFTNAESTGSYSIN